ncbi:HutP family protein [Bradyrhizobium oligotrophicum]|uniref:HutP family protein n=1 Tax=Bradyrhizobium oligotrophicum TaxID=44255 RepID=UPI003EBD0911
MQLELSANRIGKVAMILAMSSEEEEARLKAQIASNGGYKFSVTWVSGRKTDINKTFPRSILNAALKNGTIEDRSGPTHALIHAGLEALSGLVPNVPGDSSLKVKVVILADAHWVVVAAYGESAFLPETNHERVGLGVMHL